jgi:hypothetical protein
MVSPALLKVPLAANLGRLRSVMILAWCMLFRETKLCALPACFSLIRIYPEMW